MVRVSNCAPFRPPEFAVALILTPVLGGILSPCVGIVPNLFLSGQT
jgi:hypothetical protein